MRIISADSAAAILNEKFEAVTLIGSAAVLTEPPYREAHVRLAEPAFRDAEGEDSFEAIVHEAELCQNLLEKEKADVVHLDTTLGGFSIEELSPVELINMKVSNKARGHLLKILPKLRRIAGEVKRRHGIDMLAIGKESVPVRIAELTAGSHAVLYACAQVVERKEPLLVGLPTRCEHMVVDGKVYLRSLLPAEHDVRGYAQDERSVLGKVTMVEMLNPVARGFRALKIKPNEKLRIDNMDSVAVQHETQKIWAKTALDHLPH
jgi:hypothetical protein